MKNVEYKNAWAFLDEYRGNEFIGEWPRVNELFHISVLRFGGNPAFRAFDPDECYTYAESEEIIKNIAGYLQANGFKAGDRIGVAGKNSPEWVFAYFAVLYLGGIVYPLDNNLRNEEMLHFIEFGNVKALFSDKERADSIDSDGSHNLIKFSLEKGAQCPWIMDMKGEYSDPGLRDAKDVASVLFTSGTTGIPKGVVLTHENLSSDGLLTQSNLTFYESDRSYAVLPLSHSYTMEAVVYLTFTSGGCVVFGKKLAMSRIMKELREAEITIFMGVPMLYNKMIAGLMAGVKKKGIIIYGAVRFMMGISGILKNAFGINIGKKLFSSLLDKLSLRTLRTCISGGGPLPVSTVKMFQELGIDFVQGYGLTEASPITHVNPVEAFRMSSVGKRLAQIDVKIVNPDSDGNGLIYIKGPMVMKEYYNNPEATAEVLHDGWLNTGDVGHQDSDGYLYITGREKNVIVTEGGKNVFPEEIEDKFQLYHELSQVMIMGYIVDEKLKKEAIQLVVHFTDEYMESIHGDMDAAYKHISSIVDDVNRTLLTYKKISKIVISEKPLPMTSSSKVKRSEAKLLFKDK